jgi:hypothetical protein
MLDPLLSPQQTIAFEGLTKTGEGGIQFALFL